METTRHSRLVRFTRHLTVWALSAGLLLLASACRTGRGRDDAGGGDTSFKPLVRMDKPDTSSDPTLVAPSPSPTTRDDPRKSEMPLTLVELNERLYGDGFLGEVFFAFDRADLDAQARARLERNASYMLSSPETKFAIEGHCDERGTNEYNLALGHRRAATAKAFLADLGIDPDRLTIMSYGEEMGVCNLANENCWSRNRRAFFRVTAK